MGTGTGSSSLPLNQMNRRYIDIHTLKNEDVYPKSQSTSKVEEWFHSIKKASSSSGFYLQFTTKRSTRPIVTESSIIQHPLQNRVSMVRVLLPLPKLSAKFTIYLCILHTIYFKMYIKATAPLIRHGHRLYVL